MLISLTIVILQHFSGESTTQKFITRFAGEVCVADDSSSFVVAFAPFCATPGVAPANEPCDDPVAFDSALAPVMQKQFGHLSAYLRR